MTALSYAVLLELPETADNYMGGRRKRWPLSYTNIPLSLKGHLLGFFPLIREQL
jgi:hypothetical protein